MNSSVVSSNNMTDNTQQQHLLMNLCTIAMDSIRRILQRRVILYSGKWYTLALPTELDSLCSTVVSVGENSERITHKSYSELLYTFQTILLVTPQYFPHHSKGEILLGQCTNQATYNPYSEHQLIVGICNYIIGELKQSTV